MSPMHLNGKNRKMSFSGRKIARNEQMDRRFMFMKILAQGVFCPCPGAIYMTTIIFKQLLLANQSQTLYGASLRLNKSFHK